MRARPYTLPALAAMTLAWFMLVAAFNLYPQADIATSGYFFGDGPCRLGQLPPCGAFRLADAPEWAALRTFLHYLPAFVVIVTGVSLAAALARGRRLRYGANRLKVLIIAAFLLGPGLLVNGILKAWSGRPRPIQSDIYGGNLPFVAAGDLTAYCPSNCSFVSGEAAAAAILLPAALLAPAQWRKPALALAFFVSLFTAGLRVAFGAHYLSDAGLAWLLTLIVFAWLDASLPAWPQP